MNKALVYYFFFSILTGTCIYFAALIEIELPRWVRFYVNDFLIIPIVLTIVLYLVRKIGNKEATISLLNIVYLSLVYALIFEYWLPTFHPRYTADSIDVVLYFVSGFIFYFLQKKY
ncbi:MAG: hypothetical protein HWD85_00390 [Flavobacteriaceae bacterium]|nr:hypothetical protein [Flavobacteriaceae bacterium]